MPKDLAAMLTCPLPLGPGERIQLGHGGGGRLTAQLIEKCFIPAFRNPYLAELGDGAVIPWNGNPEGERLAFTTDTFVVHPIFFPGGDIGSLAIHGTANDLAMCGARPLCFSSALVLEEGFPLQDLERVVRSMAEACARLQVPLVTGDTKVVDRGKGDGVFINTSGIGRVQPGVLVGASRARPGDAVLVSGPVGDHGIAIMAAREGFEFESELLSDSAAVSGIVQALLEAVPQTHVLRDPTRGGLATALAEISTASQVGMLLDEGAIPIREEVRGACELLGFDPLYVACEGRFLAIVPGQQVETALAAIRSQPGGQDAQRIGTVRETDPGRLVLRTAIGSQRLLEKLSGEQLPRIC